MASVYSVTRMAARRVIGIDAGGTKLLGGVVDEDLTVHARVHRLWGSPTAPPGGRACSSKMVAEVEEALEVAPDAEAVGFGIPSLVDRARAASMWSNHLPLDDIPFRDLMSERLGLPVYVENDGNAGAPRRAHPRCGARRLGCAAADARNRGRWGDRDGRPSAPRGDGVGGRARPRGRRPERAAVPGQVPEPRLPRGDGLRHRDRPGGGCGRAARPGRRWGVLSQAGGL